MSDKHDKQAIESLDRTLSINLLVKIITGSVFVIGWTIAIYSWVSGIDRKLELFKQESTLVQRSVDRQLVDLTASVAKQEQSNRELTRAIDRATILLEELTKQMRTREVNREGKN